MSVPEEGQIPSSAEERVVERYESGAPREVHYFIGVELVGVRLLHADGRPEVESPRREGVRDGVEYEWDDDGQLRSATPYADGLEHGVARQWGRDGTLLGTYEMRYGTGIDLWRAQREDGSPFLAEARWYVSGQRHGPEWLIDEDQTSAHRETRFAGGLEHGILREWDSDGGLMAGYPRFYLLDREVDRDEYEHGRSVDIDLPAYSDQDDSPTRRFPESLAPYLTPPDEGSDPSGS